MMKLSPQFPKGLEKVTGYDLGHGTHGTTFNEDVDRTGMLSPSQEHKKGASYSISDPTRAYYTADVAADSGRAPSHNAEREGWSWAGQSHGMQPDANGIRGRPVVHDVEPVGSIDVDRNLNEHGTGPQFTADKLRVTNTHWIPSPASGNHVGVQGTLPHVNWNQFSPPSDPDHPTPNANSVNLGHQNYLAQRDRDDAGEDDAAAGRRAARRPAPAQPGQQALAWTD